MRHSFLSFSPPSLGEEEIAEVIDTLRSDWITTGPKVRRFEQEFAAFTGAPAALALSSCTAALHVALATLRVGPGDQVISTPMTFCSSIHVIEHVGAQPLLVDVQPDTLNIDPGRVAEAAERQGSNVKHQAERIRRVAAILLVHLYGQPCEMDALVSIARAHGLAIVEDAAHALPAYYKGQMIGCSPTTDNRQRTTLDVSRLTCFSFYATKNLTTAEGGMLTGAPKLIDEARIWGLHGMSRDAWKRYSDAGSWYYEVVRAGFKYNMTDIQAALGLHQLRRLPALQARRREIVRRYSEAFSQLPELEPPLELPEVTHAWHIYALRLNLEQLRLDRAQFIEELKARNIGTSVHFIPIHLHPYYRDKYGYRPEDFPVAYRQYQRLVSLPLYPRMGDRDVQDVIDAVADVVAQHRR
jgi:dTDP-4-amino-4,6-dideoxygalactose transaminase